MLERNYVYELSREMNLFDVKSWYLGESEKLKKVIDFGFYNTFFVSENKVVKVYYDLEEIENFEKALEKNLDEKFFNEICEYFFQLINSEITNNNEDIFNLTANLWPALTIFDEISKYPEWANEEMIRRLIRIRKSKENYIYELAKRLNLTHEKNPKDYIFFKGRIFFNSLTEFLKENNFIIENE